MEEEKPKNPDVVFKTYKIISKYLKKEVLVSQFLSVLVLDQMIINN